MNPALWLLRTLWTAPTSAVGLFIGLLATPFGARWQIRRGALEIYGGLLGTLMQRHPLIPGGIIGITFGDVILGRNARCLDLCRDHEHVHVKQAHRWGPFFIPAYLIASLAAWMRGHDAYRGNVFEVEAYSQFDSRRD